MNKNTLNLLPPKDQAHVGYERMGRFFFLFHGIIATLVLIGIILLLPSYFFIYFQHAAVQKQIMAEEEYLKLKNNEGVEHAIQETNKKIRAVAGAGFSKHPSVTPLVFSIVEQAGDSISLGLFSYHAEEKKIEIRGVAATRDELLTFVNRLKNNPGFTSVDSPVTNILKDRENKFTITLLAAQN